MPAIREYVRGMIGETYTIMTADGEYDGKNKPDVFGNAIALELVKLFVPDTDEDALDAALGGNAELVKEWVAARAAHRVIPQAIDWVMQRMGQSDRLGTAQRGDPIAAGETRTYYDRITALQRIDALLVRQIQGDQEDILAIADSLLRSRASAGYGGPAVSSIDQPSKTTDPALMPSLNRGAYDRPFTAQWGEVVP